MAETGITYNDAVAEAAAALRRGQKPAVAHAWLELARHVEAAEPPASAPSAGEPMTSGTIGEALARMTADLREPADDASPAPVLEREYVVTNVALTGRRCSFKLQPATNDPCYPDGVDLRAPALWFELRHADWRPTPGDRMRVTVRGVAS